MWPTKKSYFSLKVKVKEISHITFQNYNYSKSHIRPGGRKFLLVRPNVLFRPNYCPAVPALPALHILNYSCADISVFNGGHYCSFVVARILPPLIT